MHFPDRQQVKTVFCRELVEGNHRERTLSQGIDGSDCGEELQHAEPQKDDAERDPSDGHAAASHKRR
jgi:hypothetical protein